jgi:uncharacterized protein
MPLDVIHLLAQQIGCFPSVEKVILYGSQARGNAGRYADIDLAVVCPQASEEEWLMIRNMEESPVTIRPIDIRRYDTLKDPLKTVIHQEGKVLYERPARQD